MGADVRNEPERLESSFRHGSITAVGVITAFSLAIGVAAALLVDFISTLEGASAAVTTPDVPE